MIEIIKDTLIDSIKLLPFLFITYILMEYIEHKMGKKSKEIIKKSAKETKKLISIEVSANSDGMFDRFFELA